MRSWQLRLHAGQLRLHAGELRVARESLSRPTWELRVAGEWLSGRPGKGWPGCPGKPGLAPWGN